MALILKICGKCNIRKLASDFYKNRKTKDGYHYYCRTCLIETSNKRRKEDPRYRLWVSSYCNAKNKEVPHTIKVSDIPMPETCIYLGIKLDYRHASERNGKRYRVYNAPSIDRIQPRLGYIPGNIQVISDLANRMKQDATIQELVAFAHGVLKLHGKTQ